MARRWTKEEEDFYARELRNLYSKQNLSLKEVSEKLKLPQSTLYDRLIRLNIEIQKEEKEGFLNKRRNFNIPEKRSNDLAEFFGIMLGDGCLNKYQVIVTLGNKEISYAKHVCKVLKSIFNITPKISTRKTGYVDVYFGSKEIVDWLLKEGLVFNKVKSQVDIPGWILEKESYMKNFVRGFFDTDGSVYKLKYGTQISFRNKSAPLLATLHKMLKKLEYRTSEISSASIYITRQNDVDRFFKEISPKNPKHQRRYKTLTK